LLSAKEYTWLFASGDSGDWLAASNWWIVPQPYGSPLYIVLGHFLDLFPGDLVIKMTIMLSCLPAAITVTLVYLIVKHLTKKESIAIISSVVLLGAGIFLTQATVLEQYSLAVMFVALAYYFYLKNKKWLVALSLGLGSANHILVIPLALIWLAVERKQWRTWLKSIPIYLMVGILPYSLILWLMTTDSPPLLAGNGLSFGGLNSYLGSTSVFGSLSIYALPERTLDFLALIVMSFGLAIIPIWLAFKRPWAMPIKILVVTIAFPIWYYLTCLDPTGWTFLAYSCPFIAIGVGAGLTKVKKEYMVKAVVASAVLLIMVNIAFLNAGLLAKEEPKAMEYYNEVWEIPDGSAVVTNRGGFESMALFYAMSEGKDLVPIFFTDWNYENDALYDSYIDWINNHYSIAGSNTQHLVADALRQEIPVYILDPMLKKWQPVFIKGDYLKYDGLDYFDVVEGIDLTVIVHTEENRYSVE
jgi:hypothetical protein